MNKSTHQLLVESFMKKAQQELPEIPKEPSKDVRIARAKLILEEALELIEKGLGVQVIVNHNFGPHTVLKYHSCEFFSEAEFNFIETIDGCADLKVVTTGTLSACGLEDENFQSIVDHNNLKKFGPGSYKREDGKWIKPPDFKGPQEELEIELERQQMKVGYPYEETTKKEPTNS